MRNFLLALANMIAAIWRLIPAGWRRGLFTGLLVLESRDRDPNAGLARLFAIRDRLDLVVNERAMVLGKGVHPKHRLTDYHRFFIDRLAPDARVLDIGCGYGAVARSIAKAHPNATVVGLDYDEGRMAQARAADNPPNLGFVFGDATQTVPDGPWDAIVLSNVLEHIVDRVGFLQAIIARTGAPQFLIRVPHFERDWQMAMRKEIGSYYYSDPDHEIEPTLDEFTSETRAAGLNIREVITPWGEIWAELEVVKSP